MSTIILDIVSAEKSLFSDKVRRLTISGEMGDFGIEPGHAPVLSSIKPGQIKIILESGEQVYFSVSGGFVEVQPKHVTVLADTCLRAEDLDEQAAEAARSAALSRLASAAGEEYSKALSELAQASAQIRLIRELRR